MSVRLLPLLLPLLVGMLSGCANPWSSNYRSDPMWRSVRFQPTDSVEVRTVDYERIQRYAEREREMRLASATAPQDLPPEQQVAARQRLLDALQIPEPAERMIVLGWSEFTETRQLDPYSRQLDSFARRAGADYVIVTSVYQGPVSTIVREPVTTYSHGFRTVGPGRRGPGRTYSYYDTATTWVPLQITEDSYYYQAFFLRRSRSGDPS